MVPSRLFAATTVAGILALAVACSTTPSSPVSPSTVAGGNTNADAAATLKVNAPTLVAPADGTIFLGGNDVTLEFRPAPATYINFSSAWDVELTKSDGTVVWTNITGASSSNITQKVPINLPAGDYEWRARAAQGDGRGTHLH